MLYVVYTVYTPFAIEVFLISFTNFKSPPPPPRENIDSQFYHCLVAAWSLSLHGTTLVRLYTWTQGLLYNWYSSTNAKHNIIENHLPSFLDMGEVIIAHYIEFKLAITQELQFYCAYWKFYNVHVYITSLLRKRSQISIYIIS